MDAISLVPYRLIVYCKHFRRMSMGVMAPTISDGDSWVIRVKRCLDSLPCNDSIQRRPRSSVCIFRVPKFLTDLNEKAYVPQMVSLGPLHGSKRDRLPVTDDHKVEAVRRMLDRRPGLNIEFVIGEILELDPRIRNCYEEVIPYSGETLAWILTLDGCFILEILRIFCEWLYNPSNCQDFQPIFDGQRLQSLQGFLILDDIIMLENQIPLIVLTKLLELEVGSTKEAEEKLRRVLNYGVMRVFIPFEYDYLKEFTAEHVRNSKHLLDLLRTLIISSFLDCVVSQKSHCSILSCIRKLSPWDWRLGCAQGRPGQKYNISVPSAEILRSAGIKFKRSGRDQKLRFEMKQWSATLFLPTIQIQDNTEIILRNLMALEECRADEHNAISLYAFLMDDLIDSKKDVVVLKKAGILYTNIGSDKEVAELFSALCKGISKRKIDKFDKLVSDLQMHYESRFRVMLSEFVGEHCSKPWRTVSLLAAFLLLTMTLLQTIFTIMGQYTQ